MKNLFITALLILGANAAICKTYTIHSEPELSAISKQLKPGDIVSIANGTYGTWSQVISTTGTAAKPITIQAETTGKAIFTGETDHPMFQLTGAYTTLKGLTFTGCNILKVDKNNGLLVELFNSKHCRLTDCTFTKNSAKSQFMPIVMISGNGEYNQVDHCNFTANVDNQEIQIRINKEPSPQYTLISSNTFKNKEHVSWKNFNGGECVQIGQDPILLGLSISHTTVRENTFIKCNGEPEVISNKSSQNHIAKNYFEDCEGELVLRGGHDCLIDSNTIKGNTCGIRVNGTGHTITNNNISNVKTGIRLMYGMAKSKTEIGFYIAASDCTIKNNHIENCTTGILVGDSKNADWTGKFDTVRYPSRVMQDVAPYNNALSNNVFVGVGTNVVTQ
jgi:poly(beta-D-mannuronate) lyase